MKAVSGQKWLRSCVQVVVVISLVSLSLSGCGGGSGEDADAGSDARLSALSLDGIALDQAFQSERTLYTASVVAAQASLTLTALAEQTGATVSVNGAEVDPAVGSVSIDLTEGHNLISLVVTSEDGATSTTYTLEVFRDSDSATESPEASLSGLALSGAELDQTFQPGRTIYTASVALAQETILLTPVATDTSATILVHGDEVSSGSASSQIALVVGQNLIEIQVATTDGSDSGGEGDNSASAAGAAYVWQ